jgi:phosphate transport system permease protein
MTLQTQQMLPAGSRSNPLTASRLPRWAVPATLVGTIAAMLLVFWGTPLQGRADYVVATAIVYVVVQTAVSWIFEGGRRARDRLAGNIMTGAMVLAVLPLVAVLGYTIAKGANRLDSTFIWHSMRNVAESDPGGGAYHAIVGTIQQVGIATVIAVPIGLLVSIYLVEYAQGSRYGRLVSTFVDVMTGLPSIVAGLFILSFWILLLHQDFSGFAGSLALIILMLPVVVRTTEEILRLVPDALREASAALGVPRWRTVMSVVLPTALPGITTGVMLAIARVTGETAPVLLTVFGSQSINNNPFHGPQESLPLFVFSEAQQPNDTALDRAWAGALTLIAIVVILNIVARLIVSRRSTR